ncbi:acyltransferase family protein [Photobacterium marinum]|nr:acyltransferase [Photobacterium marinum]
MNKQIPILTPLRGFAALCVVFFHARLIFFVQWKDPVSEYTHFIENSYLWVDLFFVLSGFVMMHIYQQTFLQGISVAKWRHFMWLRFSRIYPLFLSTLLVLVLWESVKYFAAVGFYGGPLFEAWGVNGIPAFAGPFNSGDTLMANFLMLHAVVNLDLSWNISSWSLSVEWLCYMVFPLLIPMLSVRSRNSVWMPVVIICIWTGINKNHGSLDVTGDLYAFIRGLCGFAMGAWLRNVVLSLVVKKWFDNDAALLSVFLMSLWLMHLPKEGSHNVYVVLVFSLMVFIAAQQSERQTPVFKMMDNRVTRFLGDISYSVYLWHAVLLLVGVEVLNLIAPEALASWFTQTSWSAGMWGMAAFMAVTILISSLSYYGLERPAMKYLRKKFQTQRYEVSKAS